MKYEEKIVSFFANEIPVDCSGVISRIEYYSHEPGFKLQGDCVDTNDEFIRYMSYRDGISWDLAEILDPWNFHTISSDSRWNKAEFAVYKDGRHNVRTWWDEEFQKSLYLE